MNPPDNPNPQFLNRQGHPAHPEGARLGTWHAKFNRAQNMTTHPNATARGRVLGLRFWTQPLEALATRGGVLAVGRYFRIKAKTCLRWGGDVGAGSVGQQTIGPGVVAVQVPCHSANVLLPVKFAAIGDQGLFLDEGAEMAYGPLGLGIHDQDRLEEIRGQQVILAGTLYAPRLDGQGIGQSNGRMDQKHPSRIPVLELRGELRRLGEMLAHGRELSPATPVNLSSPSGPRHRDSPSHDPGVFQFLRAG